MKMTVQDVIIKVRQIDEIIRHLEKETRLELFDEDQLDLVDPVELLIEYRDKILETKIDI